MTEIIIELGYSHAVIHLADIPVKKLRRLLHKRRKVRVFAWRGIRKKYHCLPFLCIRNLSTQRRRSVRFHSFLFQRETLRLRAEHPLLCRSYNDLTYFVYDAKKQKLSKDWYVNPRGDLALPDSCGFPYSKRSHYGNGNENVKKQLVKIIKTTTLHVHHAFLYISLPSLYDYDVNRLISRFIGSVNIRRLISLTLCISGYFFFCPAESGTRLTMDASETHVMWKLFILPTRHLGHSAWKIPTGKTTSYRCIWSEPCILLIYCIQCTVTCCSVRFTFDGSVNEYPNS